MTLHDIRVSRLGSGCEALLAAMHAEAFEAGEVWDEASFGSLLSIRGTEAIVAMVEGQPAGFLLLRTIADESEILTLAVRPNVRRLGIGACLVRESMKDYSVFLEVSVLNKGALRLYKRCGFSEVGRRASYYADGSGALVLLFKP